MREGRRHRFHVDLSEALQQVAGLRDGIRQLPAVHEDCGGCPTDPAEYMHCPRWQAEDPACRPKKRTR